MATQVLSDISSALSQLFAPILDRQFNRDAVLLDLLDKQEGAGKNLAWDVRFSRSTHAASFTEGADVAAGEYNVDPTAPATLPWGQYRVAFSLSGLSVAAAQSSPGSAMELLNQFESHLEDAASDLVSQLNAAAFTGDGTGSNMAGISGSGMIASTGSYAGISQATYAEWAANVMANGGTPRALTEALLDQLELAVFKACGKQPDVIVCDGETANAYKGLFSSVQRVMLDRGDVSGIAKPGQQQVSAWTPDNSGYTGLSYKGIPVYRDRQCPAGSLFMLNRQFLKLRYLPPAKMPLTPQSGQVAAKSSKGLVFKVEPLAKTGDADKFQIVTYLQMQARRRNALGAIVDLNT